MAKDNGSVKSISDVAPVDTVTPAKERETLEGIRATIHNEVVDQFEQYAKETKLERGVIVEMALRSFFAASRDARVSAYDATMAKRQPSKINIL